MNTRIYKHTDFTDLMHWWRQHWGDAPNPSMLPSSGLISQDEDGVDRAAGWLYLDTTTPTALLCWLVANPENSARESHAHLVNVVEGLKVMAHSQTRLNIIAVFPNGTLSRLLQKCGFEAREENMKTLNYTI